MATIYSPLNPTEEEIRVLTISPSNDANSTIHCSLQVVSLKNFRDFEALSYMWGAWVDMKEIYVEDTPFPVLPNLQAVLRRLRDTNQARVIWADYICINQSDVVEKNTQIPLMGKIYANAKRTIAWLGEPTEYMQMTLSWLQAYQSNKYIPKGRFWRKLKIGALFSKRKREALDRAHLMTIIGWREIVLSGYWTRMWTFQEYCLPQHEPLCMTGDRTFSYSLLLKKSQVEISMIHKSAIQTCNLRDERVLALLDKQTELSNRQEQKDARDPREHLLSYSPLYDDGISLRTLLHITKYRTCTDPRDRLYALYGLCPAAQEACPPDYKKPPESVFHELAAYIARTERSSELLQMFPLRENHLLDTSLQSWVPDISNTHPKNGDRIMPTSTMEPFREDEWDLMCDVVDDGRILQLHGRVVGECRVIFRFASEASGPRDITAQILQYSRDRIEQRPSSWKKENAYETFTTYFKETQAFDSFPMSEMLTTMMEITQCFETEDSPVLPDTLCCQMLLDALPSLTATAVFCIDIPGGSLFGLGPSELVDGDIVIAPVCLGSPLILRDVGVVSEDDMVEYKMVGLGHIDLSKDNQNRTSTFSEYILARPVTRFLIC